MRKHNVKHILISEKIFSHMPHLPTINMLISKKHSIELFSLLLQNYEDS
jgi:hypothetical protein